MTIVCGTDLSHSAVRAAHAAAAIAQRLRVPLKLVHVFDQLGAELVVQENAKAFGLERARLDAEAKELRERFEIDVEPIAIAGHSDHELVAIANSLRADFLVVAAAGHTQRHRWLLGSVAERVSRHAAVPVLVIRDDSPITAWARGQQALQVMVCVDMSDASRIALHWAAGLRRIAPVDLTLIQLTSPESERVRLGAEPSSPRPSSTLSPAIEEILRRDLRAWMGQLPGAGKTEVVVHGCTGRVDWELSQFAASLDLVVLGTNQRKGLERVWNGSITRGVLKHATTNVACVPRFGTVAHTTTPKRIESVLVSTDMSPLANRAMPVAYGMVPTGGRVHLVHVVPPGRGANRELEQALLALVPPGVTVDTKLHVIESDDVAEAISQTAARLGVDVVCMATHGRSGLSALVMSSQAKRVLGMLRKPLVLVPSLQDK